MAKGKKADEQTLEVARAFLAAGESVAEVSRKLKVPESTVRGWRKKFEREDEGAAEAAKMPVEGGGGRELLQHYASDNFAELRALKKREMIERAWRIIEKSQLLTEKGLDRAIEDADKIDNVLLLLSSMGSQMSAGEFKAALKVLTELKVMDVGKLSSVMGTMYDKQALAFGEETAILGGSVDVRRFEDL